MVTTGGDYAWQHPDPAALAAAGFTFVCRYFSPDPTKNLTLAEAQQLEYHGLAIVSNFESTALEAENGYNAGVADAKLALAQATAAGMPTGRPIYFSVDEGTTVGPHLTGYFQGVASVLGIEATGAYGGYTVIKQLLDDGLIDPRWAWQTLAWSGNPTVWDPRAAIRQVHNGLVIGGAQVDLDQAWTADFGQWTPGEDEVQQADIDKIVAAIKAELEPDIETQVSNGVKFTLTDEDGEFQKALAGQAAMEDKLAQIAQGVSDSYANLLKLLPTAIAAEVVKELPGTQVDAAAVEKLVEDTTRTVLEKATISGSITVPAQP